MQLTELLLSNKCPHCKIDSPNLRQIHHFMTKSVDESDPRFWRLYICQRCGGAVTAYSWNQGGFVEEVFPKEEVIDESIPLKAKSFLEQAINSVHAPSGAIMLCASSVDSMLKNKGYSAGSLYSRINDAVNDNLITESIAKWAHEVRLDANDERHADEDASLPTVQDARRTIEFTLAISQYLFVLPSRIQRGIEDAS